MSDAQIVLSAVDQTRAAFESAKSGLVGLKTSAVGVTAAFSALGITAAAINLGTGIKRSIADWDELGKAAQRAGFQSAQSMAEFQFAAKLAGVDAAGFETAIGKLSVRMAGALGGSKEAGQAFADMGVRFRGTTGNLRDTESVLGDIARKFSGWKDGPEKSALAMELFGKSGKELIPFLNGGAEGLVRLQQEFRRLRGELSDGTVKQSEQFNDNLLKLQTSGQGLARVLAEQMLPELVNISTKMVEAAKQGGLLRGVWAGLVEFGKIAMNTDATGKAITQTTALNTEMSRLGSMVDAQEEILKRDPDNSMAQRRLKTLSEKLRLVQKDALAASDAVKSAIDPAYEVDPSYSKLETNRLAVDHRGTAPVVKKVDPGTTTASAYDALIKRIKERIAVSDLEVQKGRELTEEEKFSAKVLQDVVSAKKDLTEAQKKTIDGLLAESKNLFDTNALRAKRLKMMQTEAEYIMEVEDDTAAALATDSKAREQLSLAINGESEALQQAADLLTLEGKLIGATDRERTVAIENLRIEQKLRKDLWDLDHNSAYNDNEGSRAIERARLNDNAALAKSMVDQRASIDEFQRVWGSIDQTAHDTFVNIFEGGKDAFTKLRDTLKSTLLDLLYQMTVKKWIFSIGASVTGMAGGTAQAAGSNILGTAASNGVGNYLAGTASAIGTSYTAGAAASVGVDAFGVGTVGSAGGMMSGVTAAMGAIPVWGWAALAAAAVVSFMGTGGGPKSEAGYAPGGLNIAGLDTGGNMQGSQRGDVSAAQKISEGISASYASLATQLGIVDKKLDVGIFYSQDNAKGGTSLTQLQVTSSTGYNRGTRTGGIENVQRGDAALQTALAEETVRLLIDGLKNSDLPTQFKDVLNGLTSDAGTTQMQAAIDRITTARTQQLSLEEQLYQLTHTDAEKLLRTREQERAAIDPLNKALLEQVYAQQDLAAATAAASAAAQAAADKAKAVASERDGLETQLLQLQGNTVELRARELAKLDDSNRALQTRIWALQDEAAATTAARNAFTAASDAWSSVQTQAAQAVAQAQQQQISAGRSVAEFLKQLSTTRADTASPEALLANTRTNYIGDLSAARGGDTDALGRIAASAQAYIDAQKGYTASGTATQAVISQVISELDALPAVKSYQDQSLTLMQQQLTAQQITARVLTTAGFSSTPNQGTNTPFLQFSGGVATPVTAGNQGTSTPAIQFGGGVAMPSYDVGTPFVPQTGPALIHYGERVVTAADNRSLSQSSAALEMKIDQLIAVNQRQTEVIASYAQRDLALGQQVADAAAQTYIRTSLYAAKAPLT